MIGIFSQGMRRISNLEVLLGDIWAFRPQSKDGLDAIAGWGHKNTANKARHKAREWEVPYLAVEDGFLRSVGLGVLGSSPLSVVVDDLGVYYDATEPSRLEQIIRERDYSKADLEKAELAIEAIFSGRLSKYNHAPELAEELLVDNGRKRVLLIDQTRNDASVELGLADAASFADMVATARRDHPDADILVKVHPDVMAGKKQGYLADGDIADFTLIDFDVNPLSLLREVDYVYTVSSQMGFEALLAGCKVCCFGMPFYAGWGLTNDKLTLQRRSVDRTLTEIFAAAYIRYARYVDPYTGERTDIMGVIDILTDQKRHNDRNRGTYVCAGFSWWRKGFASHFFKSTDGDVLFRRTGKATANKARRIGGRALVWSAKVPNGTHAACAEQGVSVVGVEDGFLRSSGLGSDFHWPYSLCMDGRGAYFDPSRPSDLEVLLRETAFSQRLLERARSLREKIVGSGITKYNVGLRDSDLSFASDGRLVILVVGQVEDDKSIELGGLGIHSDLELLKAVREKRPDAYVIYKPHPDVISGNRDGGAFNEADKAFYDIMLTDVSLSSLFPVVDELHTLTSLSGFEALLRGVPVHTYGGPFYAGWGLTIDRANISRRNRKLQLDELVAGVLILYPSYYDWSTEMFCGPEVVLHRLATGEKPRQGVVRQNICKNVDSVIKFFK